MTKRKTWAQRIASAKRRGIFTEEDAELASRWNTCAVGEALKYPSTETRALTLLLKIPTLDNSGLGVKFCNAILCNDFAGASKMLKLAKVIARG